MGQFKAILLTYGNEVSDIIEPVEGCGNLQSVWSFFAASEVAFWHIIEPHTFTVYTFTVYVIKKVHNLFATSYPALPPNQHPHQDLGKEAGRELCVWADPCASQIQHLPPARSNWSASGPWRNPAAHPPVRHRLPSVQHPEGDLWKKHVGHRGHVLPLGHSLQLPIQHKLPRVHTTSYFPTAAIQLLPRV